MAKKFIITRRGIMRLGNVRMHKDLLQPNDICMGGGFWRFDPISMQLALNGASYDFGAPMWDYLCENHISLKVPHDYQGLRIVYQADDAQEFRVSEEMRIEYV
ncbi:MAG: hypothetical protein ACOYJK_07805 [Prevotella sp.]|jgi:hypothetical protein